MAFFLGERDMVLFWYKFWVINVKFCGYNLIIFLLFSLCFNLLNCFFLLLCHFLFIFSSLILHGSLPLFIGLLLCKFLLPFCFKWLLKLWIDKFKVFHISWESISILCFLWYEFIFNLLLLFKWFWGILGLWLFLLILPSFNGFYCSSNSHFFRDLSNALWELLWLLLLFDFIITTLWRILFWIFLIVIRLVIIFPRLFSSPFNGFPLSFFYIFHCSYCFLLFLS